MVGLDERLILKIFPPFLRGQFESERISLAQLRGRLSVPIPEIVLEGERDQWPYLVITRLSGVLGSEAWPGLPEDQKERVLAQIGETIAQVQRVPVGDLARHRAAAGRGSWRSKSRDAGHGISVSDCRQNSSTGWMICLRDAEALIALDAPPVILTGEYIPENFLLSCEGGDWRLSGLIDFGDVMTGRGEYDLLGPSAFMTAGCRVAFAACSRGFGYSSADIDFTLKRRLMALHAAAPLQRSRQAHLHRRLAGARPTTSPATGIALAGLSGAVPASARSDYSSTMSKSLLAVPHSGQTQSSGTSAHLVPGARPSSGCAGGFVVDVAAGPALP